MWNEYQSMRLSDVIDIITEKVSVTSIAPENYVSTGNMIPDFGGIIAATALPSVNNTSSYQKEDILFSNIRTYFRKLWFADMDGGCSNDVIVFRARKGILPKFAFYSLMNEEFISYTVQTSKGTKMPRGDKDAIAEYLLSVPPIDQQKAIANILGTLDDSIDLNRQMNVTLEAMAQALFKSWFVDFDPVIDNALAAGNPIPEPLQARAEARKTLGDQRKSLPESIQNQFPNRYVFNDDMGWVPEGWGTRPVYDVAEFINGAAFKGSHFSPDGSGFPIVKIAEVKNGISGQTKFTEETLDPKYRINDEEILFSWSGNPDTSIDTFVWSNGPGWLNQHVFKVSLLSDGDREFVYYLLRHLKPVFTEIARDKQTTGLGHVTAGDMKKLFVISPPVEILNLFSQQASTIFDRWYSNLAANKQLAAARDTLLPKLLSGQLRITEAEQQVAEVL